MFQEAGYYVIASSRSLGAFDLIAFDEYGGYAVQVKSNAWPGAAEMAVLESTPVPANVRKMVVRWRDRQRKPDVRLF